MYLVTSNKKASAALRTLAESLGLAGTVHSVPLVTDLELFWMRSKPSDNLHIYGDRIVIGKADFQEPSSERPIWHNPDEVAPRLHPLLNATTIKLGPNGIRVTPNQHAEVFWSKRSVSDLQLLIAKAEQFRPSRLGTLVLGTVGYFPGDLTLFSEVKKLPFLETLDFPAGTTQRHGSFEPKAPNDEAMVERLIEIVPLSSKPSIALSAGLDSRFVLGCLITKGLKPSARTRKDHETDLVEEVCRRLGLPLVPARHDLVEGYKYTLMSDARIYHRGGNYSQMFHDVTDEVLHNGLFADSIIENTFRTAWKKPGRITTIYSDLIRYALLSNCPVNVTGVVGAPSRQELHEELRAQLRGGETYAEFRSRKQWASWFYYFHRGLNWTPATMADASYFAYPVYLLGDRVATEYGLTSSPWSNFYKERLRVLNRQLLPEVPVDYSEGRPWKSRPPVINGIHKLWYEYAERLVARRRGIRQMQGIGQNPLAEPTADSHSDLTNYFTRPLDELVTDETVTRNVKRAGVTVNNVLNFLDAVPIG